MGKPLIVRKKSPRPEKRNHVSIVVKKKSNMNVKGFAAKISHNLGKKNNGLITQIINTKLFST